MRVPAHMTSHDIDYVGAGVFDLNNREKSMILMTNAGQTCASI
jgi:hypothetical protein